MTSWILQQQDQKATRLDGSKVKGRHDQKVATQQEGNAIWERLHEKSKPVHLKTTKFQQKQGEDSNVKRWKQQLGTQPEDTTVIGFQKATAKQGNIKDNKSRSQQKQRLDIPEHDKTRTWKTRIHQKPNKLWQPQHQ